MIEFTSEFVKKKNALSAGQQWLHLLEVQLDATSTAYLVSHPETVTYNGKTYAPYFFNVGEDKSTSNGSLPIVNVDVSNFGGLALKIARDHDLTLNDVTIRLVEQSMLSNVDTSDSYKINLKVISAGFTAEAARFVLGFGFTFNAVGPNGSYNRRDFPSIPYNFSKFGII